MKPLPLVTVVSKAWQQDQRTRAGVTGCSVMPKRNANTYANRLPVLMARSTMHRHSFVYEQGHSAMPIEQNDLAFTFAGKRSLVFAQQTTRHSAAGCWPQHSGVESIVRWAELAQVLMENCCAITLALLMSHETSH